MCCVCDALSVCPHVSCGLHLHTQDCAKLLWYACRARAAKNHTKTWRVAASSTTIWRRARNLLYDGRSTEHTHTYMHSHKHIHNKAGTEPERAIFSTVCSRVCMRIHNFRAVGHVIAITGGPRRDGVSRCAFVCVCWEHKYQHCKHVRLLGAKCTRARARGKSLSWTRHKCWNKCAKFRCARRTK